MEPGTHDGDAVVVNVCLVVKLLLDLGVLTHRPVVMFVSIGNMGVAAMEITHSTPPGWRAVLLTLLGAIFNEVEWKLPFCCLLICCLV